MAPLTAAAQIVNEIGDAGETLATAQIINGQVTTINGTLVNFGNVDLPVEDIDLYRLTIVNPGAFSVSVTSTLTADNDTQLYLFEGSGAQVGYDDDSPFPFPRFDLGEFSGLAAGNYFLAFNIYPTHPTFDSGTLSGWTRNGTPFQTGAYTLSITGTGSLVEVDGGVPEPSAWALMILGFGAAGGMLRRGRTALA